MLLELLGVAVCGVALVAQVKSKMDTSDWSDRSSSEKISSVADGINNLLEDSMEHYKDSVRRGLRDKRDSEIRAAMGKFNPSDWQYELLEDEARRRNLI